MRHKLALALVAGVAGCSAPPEDVELASSPAGPGKKKPDAGIDAPPPPPPPPPDAAVPDAPPPPPPPPPGFVDACQVPGMTVATLYRYDVDFFADEYDEGATSALPLPFPFTFLGTAQTQYWVTSNGELGFGGTPGGRITGLHTCPLPDPENTSPAVLAFLMDLIVQPGGVCMATIGTAPSRQLVVTWKDALLYDDRGAQLTFSAMLSEGTNAVDVALYQIDAPGMPPGTEQGDSAAIGLQSGGAAINFSCNQPMAPEGTTFHYAP